MAEIDPVILQLRADMDKYRSDVLATARRVNDALDTQGKSVVRLESQIRASSGQIGSSLKGLAASFAAAFSAQQLGQMADTYTRFTNQLKVAGLEGSNLAGVQKQLYQVAQQNGVEIEAVGTLYSRAAQNQKELGASSEDLIELTRSVAASLRISGTSTNEASGALLQLGQALGSPRVQAEEFNSLLDTMQPLLREASKYIDGTGDSLSGLTRKIKDQKGPGVSNVELFNAITQAMAGLEDQAKNADLTLSGAFTNIKNSLDLFVGQALNSSGLIGSITDAAKALGSQIEDSGSVVSQFGAVLAEAFKLIAENIGTLIEAISVLSALMVGRFAAGMVAGAASTGIVSSAIFAMQARAVGAATSMEALAFASRAAGASMLAAFGGPVGLAVTALTLGIGYLATRQDEATNSTKNLTDRQAALNAVLQADQTDKLTGSTNGLSNARARLTGETLRLAKAEAELRLQQAQKAAGLAKRGVREVQDTTYRVVPGTRRREAVVTPREVALANRRARGGDGTTELSRAQAQADKELAAATQAVTAVRRAEVEAAKPQVTAPGAPKPAATGGTKKAGSKGSGRTGPDPDEIARRFADDLAQGEQAVRQAQAEAIGTAEARRDLAADQIEYERARNARQINADKDLTEAQKTQLLQQNERIAEAQRQAINADALREAQERDRQATENQAQYAEDALRADASLATTRQASLAANLRILDSLEAQEKAHLETQIASREIADAEKARADLARTQAARRKTTSQDHEGPLAGYSRGLNESNIADQAEQYAVDEAEHVRQGMLAGLQKAIGTKDPLLTGLLNIFLQQVIFKPIAAALAQISQGSGGGLGGLLGSIIGSASSAFGGGGFDTSAASGVNWNALPKFAKGTNNAPGGLAIVGEEGPEVVDLPRGARVIPNNRLNARAAASMAGVTAAGASALSVQQNVTNYYGPGAKEFWGEVDGRAARVADPIARQHATQAGATAYKQSMKDAPGSVRRAQRFRTT